MGWEGFSGFNQDRDSGRGWGWGQGVGGGFSLAVIIAASFEDGKKRKARRGHAESK